MTLEDFIEHNKGVIKHLTCGYEVLAYLEELKHLRTVKDDLFNAFNSEHCCPYDDEECSKTNFFVAGGNCARRKGKMEIEVYKKAFELVCVRLGEIEECNHCIAYGCDGDDTCDESIAIRFLQKAREQK